jgi:deferrochelatase/peroxidase EfeB
MAPSPSPCPNLSKFARDLHQDPTTHIDAFVVICADFMTQDLVILKTLHSIIATGRI